MKQATRDALTSFLDSRLSIEGRDDIWRAIDDCVDIRQREGKDSSELALNVVALLGMLEADLTPDEYGRAKSVILEEQTPAQDATIRCLMASREHRKAMDEVRPLVGDDVLACDSTVDIYRIGLERLGLDGSNAPLDAARAMFRSCRQKEMARWGAGMSTGSAPTPDSPLFGVAARRKA
ncbi:hypothetical protein [Brytella acorum]|uniref:hypothetical protein n=1 Tax=Brytella acorum TaxID=2959299 RepID=UPI0025AE636F|nr:hypothetical protein [Brytella acorum]MDF3625781.1 hypothetical protein [Brytella acorum]